MRICNISPGLMKEMKNALKFLQTSVAEWIAWLRSHGFLAPLKRSRNLCVFHCFIILHLYLTILVIVLIFNIYIKGKYARTGNNSIFLWSTSPGFILYCTGKPEPSKSYGKESVKREKQPWNNVNIYYTSVTRNGCHSILQRVTSTRVPLTEIIIIIKK